MFKKTIAGVMSAVLCTSALLTPDLDLVGRNAEQTPAASPASVQNAADTGLAGSNAFSKFLAQKSQQPTSGAMPKAMPLKASAAEESYFTITDLKFDAETGIVQACTSQTETCRLVVNFVDEDNPQNIYKFETDVQAGDYVTTSASADLSRLPAFYSISAMLTDDFGLPVSTPFSLTTYTRKMQDILEKDICDFEPERVVNLDTDESTNFFVLSEDTVIAEASDSVNTLVSADYDQNIYVFDNIDDSIRSLEQGDYFYIRPTKDDIITVSVQDIAIDGDTATLTGGDEIDDMFDFIKLEMTIENQHMNIGGQAPAAAAEDDAGAEQVSTRSYNSGQTITDEEQLEDAYDKFQQKSDDPELHSITRSRKISHQFTNEDDSISFGPEFQLDYTIKWNTYTDGSYLNVFFVIEMDFTASVSLSASASITDMIPFLQSDDDDSDHQVEIPIPIPSEFAGIVACVFVDFDLSFSGKMSFKFEKKCTKGFVYDSSASGDFDRIDFDSKPAEKKLEAEGSVSLEIKIGIEATFLELASVSAAAVLKIEGTTTTPVEFHKMPSDGNIFIPEEDPGTDWIHPCDRCYDITITFSVGAELKAEVGLLFGDHLPGFIGDVVGKMKYSKTYATEFKPLKEIKAHCSINSSGDYKGIRFGRGECDLRAYRVDFDICLLGDPDDLNNPTAMLTVEQQTYIIPSEDFVSHKIFYAVPRKSSTASYSYRFYLNGSVKEQGTFKITNSTQNIPLHFSWDENGNLNNNSDPIQTGAPIMTEPVTTETEPATEPFSYDDKIPSGHMRTLRTIRYGDHILGFLANNGILTIAGYGDMYDNVILPSSVRSLVNRVVLRDQNPEENRYINNIGSNTFANMENLETVYMPSNITGIGSSAFQGCTSLVSLRYNNIVTNTAVLPAGLTTIGYHAFFNCTSAAFGDLVIPASVTTIGSYAFTNCTGITKLTIPDANGTTVASFAFSGCTNMTEASLGENISITGTCGYIFSGCSALEKLTIPRFEMGPAETGWVLHRLFGSTTNAVPEVLTDVTVTGGTAIPNNYFYNLNQLESISYPDNITVIGSHAFYNCTKLTDLPLPETLTAIGNHAFFNCTSAAFGNLVIPASVTTIGSYAFCNCTGITKLTIPGVNETTVASFAFSGCSNITEAYLGENVSITGTCGYIFGGCSSLQKLTLPAFSMGDAETNWVLHRLFGSTTNAVPAVLTDVTVTGGTAIPNSYFYNLNQLESISYPDNITVIGSHAFYNCTKLTDLPLPETLTAIGNHAFFNCTSAAFGNLVIPASVTTIGSYAFTNCTGITKLTIPGVNETTVASFAFSGCSNITEAYLGENVSITGTCGYIFGGCNALEKLTIPRFELGPAETGWVLHRLFGSTASTVPAALTDVTVTGGTAIPNSYFYNLNKLESVSYPDNITAISSQAFSGCTKLTDLPLPETLTAIGYHSFFNCTSAAFGNLVIPASVTTIGSYAFCNCTGITKLTIPGVNETTVASFAFSGCTNVTEAYLGENISITGTCGYIFSGCNALEKLTIPRFEMGPAETNWVLHRLFGSTTDAVPAALTDVTVTGGTAIPNSYFYNLNQLESISYPDNITAIGSQAFYNCTKLTDLPLPETLTAIGNHAFFNCTSAAFGNLVIPASVTTIGSYAFTNCTGITTLAIPCENEASVASFAFSGCSNITEAYLGENVSITGTCGYIFGGCSSLQKLTLPAFSMGDAETNWVLHRLFGSTASTVPAALTNIIVTGGTETPANYFSNLAQITAVTLPTELETVNSNAFKGCTGLSAAHLIGEASDWDNVTISENGNAPLLALVRGGHPLVICAGPYDETVAAGDTAKFWAFAAGKYELAYQWQYSADDGATWVDIDADTEIIAFTATAEQNGWLYRCVVTDDHDNTAYSDAALLIITEAETQFLLGDVDLNSVVEEADAILLAQFLTSDPNAVITDAGLINADVNQDGIIDLADITAITQMIG